jgi:hypothetical protein
VNPEVISEYDTKDKRAVTMHEGWTELEYFYLEKNVPAKWPIYFNIGRFQSKYVDHYSLETFTQAMLGTDPQNIMHGFNDVGLTVVHGQEMRDFCKIFTSLPGDKFNKVLNTDLTTNLGIREFQDDNTYWFYIVNPGYWPVKGTLTLNNIKSAIDILTRKPADIKGKKLYISIDPFDIVAFKASTRNGEITSFKIDALSDNDLAHMRFLISLAKDTYPKISNRLNLTSSYEIFLNNVASQAEEKISNQQYASAWNKLTNWKYWQLAYFTVFRKASVVCGFSTKHASTKIVDFNASQSKSYGDPIVSYKWNFGDGETGSGKQVSHVYKSEGTYTARLTVSNRSGISSSIIKDIKVKGGTFH